MQIDAIGRARSTLGADPGSMERESALLAMLVQMDGIHGKLEQVLTIGATNLAQVRVGVWVCQVCVCVGGSVYRASDTGQLWCIYYACRLA